MRPSPGPCSCEGAADDHPTSLSPPRPAPCAATLSTHRTVPAKPVRCDLPKVFRSHRTWSFASLSRGDRWLWICSPDSPGLPELGVDVHAHVQVHVVGKREVYDLETSLSCAADPPCVRSCDEVRQSCGLAQSLNANSFSMYVRFIVFYSASFP